MRLIDADVLQKFWAKECGGDCAICGYLITEKGKDGCTEWIGCKLIDNAPTVEITEEQAIDKLHETGWIIRHDKEMIETPQGDVNNAIKTIKAVCKDNNICTTCPMNCNCNEQPARWEEVQGGKEA